MNINPDRLADLYVEAKIGGFATPHAREGFCWLAPQVAADPRLSDIRHAAYVMATTWWETARRFTPISEFAPKGSDPHAYFNQKYSHRKDLGNRGGTDGYDFRGRGYPQITGRDNYHKFSDLLGIDLIGNPDLALVPEHAYEIMLAGMTKGMFTGKRLDMYIRGTMCNYTFARQIINRFDQAPRIARAAERFEGMIWSARIPETANVTPPS